MQNLQYILKSQVFLFVEEIYKKKALSQITLVLFLLNKFLSHLYTSTIFFHPYYTIHQIRLQQHLLNLLLLLFVDNRISDSKIGVIKKLGFEILNSLYDILFNSFFPYAI